MRFGLVAFWAALTLMSSVASAQWMHTEGEDDPFAGGQEQMAGTLTSVGEMLMFRCRTGDDLALLYVTIEKPDPAHKAIMAIMPVKLLVIVDDEPKREFDATVDTTPDGERYRITAVSEDLASLARLTADAKRRFAVAVEMNGKRMFSSAVSVRGSRLAIGKLASGCKLP